MQQGTARPLTPGPDSRYAQVYPTPSTAVMPRVMIQNEQQNARDPTRCSEPQKPSSPSGFEVRCRSVTDHKKNLI